MFARCFEAFDHADALRRVAQMQLWGEIVPAGRNRWIVWAA